MAGSHRAARAGSRAAAREARRQKARKRNQTIAAGVAVVLLVGGGGVAALNAFGGDGSPSSNSSTSDDKSTQSNVLADAKVLLDATTAKPLGATGAWAITQTADGSTAPDHAFVCQSQRFADPAGLRTWVRTFQNSATKNTAVQYVEVSNDASAANKAYSSILGWLGQCNTPQIRLTSSYVTTGVGQRGMIAVFGQPSDGKTNYKTIAVSVAGQATMVLEHDTTASTPPKPETVLAGAAAGVKRICAQTGCEKLNFTKAKATKFKAQTYVAPEAKVPTEFGLDDTVAKFATQAAANDFVSQIRKNVDGCEKNVSNAKVKSTGSVSTASIKGESWRATYDIVGGKTFTYRIGIATAGSRAVYVVFPVLKGLDISDSAFNETLTRAAERSVTFS